MISSVSMPADRCRSLTDASARVGAGSTAAGSLVQQLHGVRMAELVGNDIVRSVDQWDKVDTAVRQQLIEGNEVEIG